MKPKFAEVEAFVRESNKIEGIEQWTRDEIDATTRFIELPEILIIDIASLVNIYQPGNVLRDEVGLDVRVGNHVAPRGGPNVKEALQVIVDGINTKNMHPYYTHQQYEWLHPFTDGNGRSGRAIWARMMIRQGRWPRLSLGFLHAWYYQSLELNEIR